MPAAPCSLEELIQEWTLQGLTPFSSKATSKVGRPDDTSFSELLKQIDFFSQRFYSKFIPALFPPHKQDYRDRLWNWLSNEGLSSEQQQILFQFALKIAYLSFEDFLQLYHSAYVGPVTRWIIDEIGLKLSDPLFQEKLSTELLKHTWYCPVTDSMVISEFYHANGITGIDQRPAFWPLKKFGKAELIRNYMQDMGLKRLVLMEDFVGSGTQTLDKVEWAVNELKCPVLFVPLVLCPEGKAKFDSLAPTKSKNLTIESTLLLDDSAFLSAPGTNKSEILNKVAQLVYDIHGKIAGSPDSSYGPFGFLSTGAAVVLFSNTPDNSLPILHHHCKSPSTWQALFPRVSRELP